MLGKVIETIIDPIGKQKNKRVFIMAILLAIVLSSYISKEFLNMEYQVGEILLGDLTINFVSSFVGLLLSTSAVLYFISIITFVLYLILEVITRLIYDSNKGLLFYRNDEVGDMNSWLSRARIGSKFFANGSFDWLLIGVLMSTCLELTHHVMLIDYIKLMFLPNSFTRLLIYLVFALNIFFDGTRIIKTIHYHYFHFQSDIKERLEMQRSAA